MELSRDTSRRHWWEWTWATQAADVEVFVIDTLPHYRRYWSTFLAYLRAGFIFFGKLPPPAGYAAICPPGFRFSSLFASTQPQKRISSLGLICVANRTACNFPNDLWCRISGIYRGVVKRKGSCWICREIYVWKVWMSSFITVSCEASHEWWCCTTWW